MVSKYLLIASSLAIVLPLFCCCLEYENKLHPLAEECLYLELLREQPENVSYLASLGAFYEKTGLVEEAISYYQKALKADPTRDDIQITLAVAYLNAGKLEEGRDVFEGMLKSALQENDPLLAEMGVQPSWFSFLLVGQKEEDMFQEAQGLAEKQEFGKAEAIYLELLQKYPKNVRYLTALGRLYGMMDRTEDAIIQYQKALKIDRTRDDVQTYLAFAFLRQNKLEESRQLFEEILRNSPKNIEGLVGLGKTYEINAPQIAENYYKKALKIEPKNLFALMALANLYLEEKAYEKALEVYARAEKIDPANTQIKRGVKYAKSELLAQQASRLYEEERWQEAIVFYYQMLEAPAETEQEIERLAALGRLYGMEDRTEDAIIQYQKALEIDPARDDIQTSLAFAYLRVKKTEESRLLFEKILKHSPENIEALVGLGKIYEETDPRQAEEYFQKALKINSEDLPALLALANLYLEQKDYDKALKVYEKAEKSHPGNAQVGRGMKYIRGELLVKEANALYVKKQWPEAAVLYRRLIEMFPEDSDNYGRLARIYLATPHAKERGEVEHLVQKALKLDPENIQALSALGELYMQEKNYRSAIWTYTKLVKLDPEFSKALRYAKEQPLFLQAKEALRRQDLELAKALAMRLVASSPNNLDYYAVLGRVYDRMKLFQEAIDVFWIGLQIKPNDLEMLKGMGFAYLHRAIGAGVYWPHAEWLWLYPYLFYFSNEEIMETVNFSDLRMSENLFAHALSVSPLDGDSLAGYGRVLAIYGCKERAEEFYLRGLEVEPKNTTVLAYIAALWSSNGMFFSARQAYERIFEIDSSEKQIHDDYMVIVNASDPSCDLRGFYTEENEQDPITPTEKAWTSRLKNYGGVFSWNCSLCDRLRVFGMAMQEYCRLENLINKGYTYSLAIERGGAYAAYNVNPYLTVTGGLGFTVYSQFKKSLNFTRKGYYLQPLLNFTYSRLNHTAFLETNSDTSVVARDFTSNRSCLVNRQFVRAFYQYNFGKRRFFGATCANAWYINRIKRNQMQVATTWLQWTPPYIWEYLSFRYQFHYARCNKLTSDYYSFQAQTTHWACLVLSKNWLEDNRLITEAGYGRAWQRSFEQGQIIAVNPNAPFRFIHRQINTAFVRMLATPADYYNFTLTGTFTQDNFKYTTAAVIAQVHFRF